MTQAENFIKNILASPWFAGMNFNDAELCEECRVQNILDSGNIRTFIFYDKSYVVVEGDGLSYFATDVGQGE